MRTYEITRGNDLTRTFYAHPDGKVVELNRLGANLGFAGSSNLKVVGSIERRIKPGTKSSRQYRAVVEHRRPGLWQTSLERAVADVEHLTRSAYFAETRCELVDRYIAVQQSALDGATYYVARTVDGRMIGPMTGGIEFARAIVRHEIEQGAEFVLFPDADPEPVEQCPGSPYCECGSDSVLAPWTSALSDDELDQSRTVVVTGMRDRDRLRLKQFGRPGAMDLGQLDELDRVAARQLDEIDAERDRRRYPTADDVERAQLTRQHLDEWHDC